VSVTEEPEKLNPSESTVEEGGRGGHNWGYGIWERDGAYIEGVRGVGKCGRFSGSVSVIRHGA
jgi:hypothetical protein